MSVATTHGGPIAADPLDQDRYAEIERQLNHLRDARATLVGLDGDRIELPEPLLRVLREAANALARDRAVDVIPVPKVLTVRQAAHMLGTQRAYLEKRLDEGALPSSGTGTRRRVALADVLSYAERRDAQRRASLDRLTEMSQEMGYYSGQDS